MTTTISSEKKINLGKNIMMKQIQKIHSQKVARAEICKIVTMMNMVKKKNILKINLIRTKFQIFIMLKVKKLNKLKTHVI